MKHPRPFVIIGRPVYPQSSWWAESPQEAFTTRCYAELERMRLSKFSLLEPRTFEKLPALAADGMLSE